MWHFLHSKNNRWIIKALDRNTGRTVAWVVGGRDAATVRRLYCQLEHLNDCLFYTGDWEALAKVWPPERQLIGKKYTIAIEPDNPNTRHHLGRMSWRRKIVSQSEEMISLFIRLWHGLATAGIFTEYQRKFIPIYNWTLSIILLWNSYNELWNNCCVLRIRILLRSKYVEIT